jgi:hypothetical protein
MSVGSKSRVNYFDLRSTSLVYVLDFQFIAHQPTHTTKNLQKYALLEESNQNMRTLEQVG